MRLTRRAATLDNEICVTVFTIGHSTHPIDEFIGLLWQSAIDRIVDVRSIPRSRTNPQFNSHALSESLAAAGIGYTQLRALGGRRGRGRDAGPSPNQLWRNESFRNYADYAMSDAFCSGMQELKSLAAGERCAIMCAEALWWRCHRRIISDYLLADGVAVAHVMGAGKVEPATLTPGARALPDGTVLYPGEVG
jgi:uncharacterized protein (DUF488 family)